MKLEEKISRYKELKKEKFLSDQEIEELARLEEEIKLEFEGSETKENRAKPNPHYEEPTKPKKQKRSLIEILIAWRAKKRKEKYEKMPQRIKELQMEKAKALLERDIAKAKTQAREMKGKTLEGLFGSGGSDSKNDKIKQFLGDDKEKDTYREKILGKKWNW